MTDNQLAEKIQNLFQEIALQFNRLKLSVSLEELQTRYGSALDEIILREEERNHCNFLSGEFKISAVDEKFYRCAYALYFEDADEKFHTLEAQTKDLDIGCLAEDFRLALQSAGELKFEIDEPARDKNVSV